MTKNNYILDIQLNEEDAQIPFTTKTAERKLLHRNYGVLFKMRYRKEKAPFDYDIVSCRSAGRVLDCHVDDNLVTKDQSWEYEHEQRILIPMEEKGKFVSSFHQYLTGIILGIKCPETTETVQKIIELFREDGDGPIQVYQAQYSEKTFDVLVPGLENVTSRGSLTRTSSQEG